MVRLKRFYTFPPFKTEYPHILRNMKQHKRKVALHEIVDIGIYDLLEPPYVHDEDKLRRWNRIKTDGWKVVPDCPDIKGEFGIDPHYDTIRYSKYLMKKYYNPNNRKHLPVMQTYWKDNDSLMDYIGWFKKLYGIPDKVGLGGVCKLNPNASIEQCKIMGEEFPDSWVHAFGLRFRALKEAKHYIDSFDTMSWTFKPRIVNGKRVCVMANNNEERREFFWYYINKINEELKED